MTGDRRLTDGATTAFTDGTVFNVNGHTITFKSGAAPAAAAAPCGYGVSGNIATDGSGNSIVYLGASATSSTATVGDVLSAIDLASGVKNAVIASGAATITTNASQTASSIAAGMITLETSTGADLSLVGKADALKALGLTTATGAGNATVSATRTTSSGSLGYADPGRLDADRQWPLDHLQERGHAGGCQRCERLGRQRQRRHRRQRQLDGLPGE